MKPFDPTKPCRYRNGEPARILCTDAAGEQPLYAQNLKTKQITSNLLNGNFWSALNMECPLDLINTPSKKTVELWVNVYDKDAWTVWHSEGDAKENEAKNIFARKKITFEVEEGEGL